MVKKLFAVGLVIVALLGLGLYLDQTRQHQIAETYVRTDQGIIKSLDSINQSRGSSTAIIFFHGFSSSPAVFEPVIKDLNNSYNFDIYAPLLPFHGRDLTSMSEFDNKTIAEFMQDFINHVAKSYDKIIIIGFSYGAAQLLNILGPQKLSNKFEIILFAPSFFIKSNTTWGRLEVLLYGMWRRYCDYQLLGCGITPTPSGDAYAHKHYLSKIETINVEVMPAVRALYQFDLDNRYWLEKFPTPFTIMMAEDDNRLSYERVAAKCKLNPECKLYSFKKGLHYLFLSAQRDLIIEQLKQVINQFLQKQQ